MPATLPTGRPHQDPARQARHLLSNLDHRTAVTSNRKGDKPVRLGYPLPDPLPEAMPKFWHAFRPTFPKQLRSENTHKDHEAQAKEA